jgi:FkbM family methyltransferase
MNKEELVEYFINNSNEFKGESGNEKLLVGLKKYIKPITGETKIIGIDVGCCVGNYIDNLITLCPESNSTILCFEPNPVNIAFVEPIINEYKDKVQLHKYCISDITATSGFYNWKYSSVNTIGNEIACLRGGGEKICDVNIKRLDDVLDEQWYNNDDIIIKIIKIDTEGNDTNVIKSLGKYLKKTKYIIFECSDCLDDIRGPGINNPMQDIVVFLSEHGFDTYRIGTKKLFNVNDDYWDDTYDNVKFWSNCFAIKKDDNIIYELIDSNFNYIY